MKIFIKNFQFRKKNNFDENFHQKFLTLKEKNNFEQIQYN